MAMIVSIKIEGNAVSIVGAAKRAEVALAGVGTAATQAGRDAEAAATRTTAATGRVDAAARASTQRIQQAGYQIGDFFTQIGSGQSALVAATQQGSQLAQAFNPLVGAAVAVAGVAAQLLFMRDGASEAAKAIGGLADAEARYKEALEASDKILKSVLQQRQAEAVATNLSAIEKLRSAEATEMETLALAKNAQQRVSSSLGTLNDNIARGIVPPGVAEDLRNRAARALQPLEQVMADASERIDRLRGKITQLQVPLRGVVVSEDPFGPEAPKVDKPSRSRATGLTADQLQFSLDDVTRDRLLEIRRQREADDLREITSLYAAVQTPIEQYTLKLERLGQLRDVIASKYGEEEANKLIGRAAEAAQKDLDAAEKGATKLEGSAGRALSGIESRFERLVTGGASARDTLQGLAGDFAQLALRVGVTGPLFDAAETALASIFKSTGAAGGGGLGGIFSLFGFADGGVMTSRGPLPLRAYAGGGVASSPQLALFGEGRTPEAFVPLPDGRTIPVTMKGGQGGVALTVNQTLVVQGGGSDPAAARVSGEAVGKAAREAVRAELLEQSRPGGLLDRGRR
jgi:hypothetical protein